MKFSELFREIVGEQFPHIFLQVENDLLQYLRGYSLQKLKKTPDFLEQALNVFEDNYGATIKKLVNSFIDGLEAIGFSPVATSRYFYVYFKEIPIEPDLRTPDMWIYQRFQPFIRLLLADEWINFLADAPGNVIDKLPDSNVITPEVFEAANATRRAFPKLTQLVRARNTLRLICQDTKLIEDLLRFERVEENLQSLYFVTQILADLGELKRLNVPLIKRFIVQHQRVWSKKPTLLSAIAPSIIRCAVFLIDLLNLGLDLTPTFAEQIETVRALVETTNNPLKTKPFEFYNALLALSSIPHEIESDLSGLLQQLAFTPDILVDNPSLPRLGIIFEIIFLVNPVYTFSLEIQDQIQAYLQRFWTGDGFLAEVTDETPNPIANYFGFAIRKRVGLLQPADLAWFFKYFIVAYEHAIKAIDYAIPETVANVFYCKKFFNAFEMEPDFQPFGFPLNGDCLFLQPFLKKLLDCPSPEGTEIIRFKEPEIVQQEFQADRQIVAQEVAQLLREPQLTFKKPGSPPPIPVSTNPFAFLNPVKEGKRDGIIAQSGDLENILQEMGSSVGDLGKALNAVKTLEQRKAAPKETANMNPQASHVKQEEKTQETPESPVKTESKIKKTQKELLEEQFALDEQREKLMEWLIKAIPTATKYQMESYVAEILKMEKNNQIDAYLEFLRREKGVDTRDFPAAK